MFHGGSERDDFLTKISSVLVNIVASKKDLLIVCNFALNEPVLGWIVTRPLSLTIFVAPIECVVLYVPVVLPSCMPSPFQYFYIPIYLDEVGTHHSRN